MMEEFDIQPQLDIIEAEAFHQGYDMIIQDNNDLVFEPRFSGTYMPKIKAKFLQDGTTFWYEPTIKFVSSLPKEYCYAHSAEWAISKWVTAGKLVDYLFENSWYLDSEEYR